MGRRRGESESVKLPGIIWASAIAATLAFTYVIAAQEPSFKVDVQLVRLLVTVKNPAGDLVGSLESRDFDLFDSGVKQNITLFEHQTNQPLSVTLLIDTSGSMAKDLKVATGSLAKFLNALVKEGNPDDAASLYSFNDEVTLLNSFTRRLTRLEDSLRPLKADAGTSLYDAIYLSTSALRDRDGRHVIVVVTDGGDTTSSKKFSDARASAQRADAVFYPIVIVPISNPAGRNIGGEHALETLAESTGGRTFYATVEQLDRTFADILRELRTQYLIGYYPRGPLAGDGKFHTVRLELPRRQDLRISTRTGYYGVVSR
jgi:Ca-activated chloride channel family protein